MERKASSCNGLSCAHLSLECRLAGWARQGWMSPGPARTPAGQRPLDVVLRGHGASAAAAAHSLDEGRARAGTGCPAGTPALRSLRAPAAEPQQAFQLLAPCLSCRTAQHCAAGRAGQGRAGQGRAGQAPGALAWRSALTGSCSLFLCSRREQQQEEEGAALALCSAADPGRCPGARAGGLRLQQATLWPAPGSRLRGGRHAAPAHPGKPAWPGGPQPSLRLLRRGAGCPQQLRARGIGLFTPATRFCSQPRLGARSCSWAVLWPPLLEGSSSVKQLSSCLSRRSCWLSCSGKGRRQRAYSAELPAPQRFGSCGRPWSAARPSTWEASLRSCWPSS